MGGKSLLLTILRLSVPQVRQNYPTISVEDLENGKEDRRFIKMLT